MTPSMRIVCPSCNKALLFRGDSPEGKMFKCPDCATVFRAPSSWGAADGDEEAAPAQRAARPSPPRDAVGARRNLSAASRFRDEDDDWEEREERRSRPRRRKSGSSGMLLILGLVGGGLFVLLLCSGILGVVIYKAMAVTWQDYSPPGGRFTATFPGSPRHQTQQAAGKPLEMYMVELRAGQFAYSVAYNDLGVDAEAMGAQAVLNGAAQGLGGTMLKKRDIQLKGHPGKEVTVEMQQNGVTLVMTNRIYVVKSRMYQVVVAGVKGKEPPASYTQFLDSFRVQE